MLRFSFYSQQIRQELIVIFNRLQYKQVYQQNPACPFRYRNGLKRLRDKDLRAAASSPDSGSKQPYTASNLYTVLRQAEPPDSRCRSNREISKQRFKSRTSRLHVPNGLTRLSNSCSRAVATSHLPASKMKSHDINQHYEQDRVNIEINSRDFETEVYDSRSNLTQAAFDTKYTSRIELVTSRSIRTHSNIRYQIRSFLIPDTLQNSRTIHIFLEF